VDKSEFYARARDDLAGPVGGIRVLDATTAWAGPMVSCVLADLGCDVIHIDRPGGLGYQLPPILPGTGRSYLEQTVNRNKRSISLDLRVPEGRDIFLQLAGTADVIVENFKPGTLDSWGVGYSHCSAVNPGIVYVSVSGWGQFGPLAHNAGYDPAALAAGGWLSLNGTPDGPPVKAPTFLSDDLAGLHGAIGALAALRHRDLTGEGQHVDVSLLDSLLFQSNGLLTMGAMGVPLKRWGGEVAGYVPCDVFACNDGYVYLAIVLDSHWARLARTMDRPELETATGYASVDERVANRHVVNGVVAEWCSRRATADIVTVLLEQGLTISKVNTFAEAAQLEHVRARDMLQETRLANGTSAPITGPAAKFSRTPTRVRHAASDPGDDTEEILKQLGIDAERRDELRARGVI
jgi:formyl-CoA transferase